MTLYLPSPVISTFGKESLHAAVKGGNGASATYPAANRAFYYPFVVSTPYTAKLLWCLNGATVSGNVDMGIYDRIGTRLVSIGSTLQSGANEIQSFNITDTAFGPGLFFVAIAMDNITGTLIRNSTLSEILRGLGVFQQSTAFALPATATLASMGSAFVPLMGLSNRTVI